MFHSRTSLRFDAAIPILRGTIGSRPMGQNSREKTRRPAYYRLGFWISSITFLVLFGLLLFGGLMGISKLFKMLWDVLGPG
jgi:hypothetical protein